MQNRKAGPALVGVAALALVCVPAQASLTTSYQFNGNGNWSLDGIGSNNNPVGTVQALVPAGSFIEQAFLYSTMNSANVTPNITLGATTYSGADWTSLGQNASATYLQAYRTDVTSQMRSEIGSGAATRFNFQVTENANNSSTDGEVLAIVYSNPAESKRTIAFLDGSSASAGDSTRINYSTPLSKVGDPGFEALVSLGIGYGFQDGGNQYSIVDAQGRRLTSSAGGYDDGVAANGGLVTVGGLDDSTDNPPDPNAHPSGTSANRYDDELYDLAKGNGVSAAPFITNGDTFTEFTTVNPSSDDNIFFLGVNITADAGVNAPPPPPVDQVPDATSTLPLLGLAVTGLLAWRRKA